MTSPILADSDLHNLRTALNVVETGAQLASRSRATELGPYVDDIIEHGYQFGFPTQELRRLVDLLSVKNELDQSSCTSLLKNLYPAERVQSDVVLLAVGALGNGAKKPTSATQAGLVRWLLAVHEVLEEPAFLLRLYAVLFNLLDLLSIRGPLCQLLSILTRRKHVRPFRIQRLLSLSQQFGTERALIDLLKVYRNFCPEIILGKLPSSKAKISPFDLEWRARLFAIQDASSQAAQITPAPANGFKVARDGPRGRTKFLPEVHSFYPSETAVTLEEVNTVDDLVNNLEKLDPPSQLVSSLNDPLLQKFLMLRTSPELEQRLNFWLETYFEEEIDLIQEGFGLSPSLSEILRGLVSFTETTRSLHPAAERFLRTYLPLWDGNSNLGMITDLLTYLRPQSMKGIHTTMLGPLERAIMQGANSPFESLLNFYGSLIRRWIMTASDHKDRTNLENRHMRDDIESLQNHVASLTLSSLVTSQDAAAAAVGYFEKLSTVTLFVVRNHPHADIPVVLPQQQIYYILLLSNSLSTLSRLTRVLTSYKAILETVAKTRQLVPAPLLTSFNILLIDTCNLLWRSRAFILQPNLVGCMCPRELVRQLQFYLPDVDRDYSAAGIFGVSFHPLLSAFSFAAFKELEKEAAGDGVESTHMGPVSERSLVVLANEGGVQVPYKTYKIRVLKWLAEKGVTGLEEFMFTALKDLSK